MSLQKDRIYMAIIGDEVFLSLLKGLCHWLALGWNWPHGYQKSEQLFGGGFEYFSSFN
jgi:hypothetical protein